MLALRLNEYTLKTHKYKNLTAKTQTLFAVNMSSSEYFICRRSPRLQKKAQVKQAVKEDPSSLQYYENTPQMLSLLNKQETLTAIALIQHMTREAVSVKSIKERVEAINKLVNYVCLTKQAQNLLAAYPPFRFRIQALITKYHDCMPYNAELDSCKLLFQLLLDFLPQNSNFVEEKV